jgi:hypothetical protein
MTSEATEIIKKDNLVGAIAAAIEEQGWSRYEDTEMLVIQGLESWSYEDLVVKAKEFTAACVECLGDITPANEAWGDCLCDKCLSVFRESTPQQWEEFTRNWRSRCE